MTRDSGETGRRRLTSFVLMRRHVTKFLRSLGSRKNVALARLGAWWEGTGIRLGRGIRFYQATRLCGEGTIRIGARTTIGYPIGGGFASSRCELQARSPEAVIAIGSSVGINNGFLAIAVRSVTIGDRCLIGKDVQILDFDAHGVDPDERRSSSGRVSPVVLGENVWVGNDAIILKGVRIGRNAIVAAGSVVTGGEYPEDSIVGGNPARVIGSVRARAEMRPKDGTDAAAHDD